MKTFRISFLLALLLMGLHAVAQDVNRLRVGDVSAMMSTSVYVPIYLENTNPSVTAVQLDLTVPDGVTMETSASYLKTEDTRVADHRVRAIRQGSTQTYRFILVSPTNQPLRANRGIVFSVRANISGTAPMEEGGTYPLTVSNVVVSDSLGHNVMTGYTDGSLIISANPDFTVTNVSLTSGSTASPSDEISLAWTVNNVGSIASQGGWKEQLSLVSTATGESCTLTAQNYTDVLAAGASVARTATVTVPRLPGIDGNFKVQVKLVPNSDSGERKEYQQNNTTQSGSTYSMRKLLYLQMPTNALTETDATNSYGCYLERSGSRASSQTFTLSRTLGSDRVSGPSSLTFSKGNSSLHFSLTVAGNNAVDDPADTLFTFRVPAANGYALVENTVKLRDDEHPTLSLTALPDELTEGETLTLTVGITPVQQDLKVNLVCSRPSRFNMPSSVTVPAGESEMSVTLTATDDDEVQDEQYIDFTVTAPNYENARATVLLKDNDMPDLQLIVTPTTVSEGAGPTAMVGRLVRTSNTNTKLTIKLSASTDTDLYLPTKTLTMPKGTTEVQFQLGVVDDAQKQGDRDVVLVAAVYIASCYCQALGTNGGVASQTIHILDDDGAALTLAAHSSNMLEGSTGNVFTVSRNDTPTTALIVSIAVDDAPDELTWPATVTIPAGQQTASFTVDLGRNATEADSRMLTFTASATDYASGTCWVQATDQTLPDAVVTAFGVLTDVVTAGHEADVCITVRNDGYAPLPARLPLMLFCGSTSSATLYTDEPIQPGDEVTLTRTVVLSEKAGTSALRVTANADRSFTELNYSNNSSVAVSVDILPLFTATVETDKSVYNNGESIIITGDVTGLESRNREIEVYVIMGGERLTTTAMTDGQGHYVTEYVLEGNVAGTLSLGVCLHGEELTTPMATVEVRGMRRSDCRFLTHELEVGETLDGYIDLYNHGNLDLTNITATAATNLPANVGLTFESLPTLSAGSTGRLIFHLTGLSVSDDLRRWQTCSVRLRSSEGAATDQTLYFVVYPSKAVLKSDASSIRTTMTKGATRTYPITIWNEGRQETGEIQIDLGEASFLSLATPQRMASLAQGEKATIMLQLTPTADMELMSVVSGNLFVGCQNGSGLNIGYRLETVSDATGTLVVDVWDEFTYNTEEAPHVEGATVALKHPVSQQLLHQAVTGSDGLATFADVAEGSYLLTVTHPKHESMMKTVLVSPGTTQTERVFIPYNAISVSMTYEKTEVEDEYDIVTTVTYETHVPKPVVVIDAPKKIIMADQQLPYVFYVHLTNVGLVKAPDLTFRLPESDNGYDFTPLINGPWDLMPQQTLTIPVQVTASVTGGDTKRRRAGLSAEECGQEMIAGWFDVCKAMNAGNFNVEDYVMHQLQVREACAAGMGGGGGGGGGLNPGDGGLPGLFSWIADNFPNLAAVSFTRPGILPAGCDPWLTDHGQDVIGGLQSVGGFAGGMTKGCVGVAGDVAKDKLGIPDVGISAKHTGKVPVYEGSGAKPRRVSGRTEWDEDLTDDECRAMWKGWMTGLKETYETANAELGYFTDPVLTLPGNTEPSAITDEMIDDDMWEASPSWWKAYVNRCVVAGYGAYHNMLYSYHVLGDVLIDVDDYTELSPLVTAVKLARDAGKSIEAADYESLKPAWLSDAEFNAVVQRLSDSSFDYAFLDDCVLRIQAAKMQAQRMGYASTQELLEKEAEKVLELLVSDRSNVCSKVRFEINQTMTMTREAVRGTLTVVNGSSDTEMRDVKLNLVVTDPDGNIANARIMEIHTETLEGFGGQLDYESGWTLAAGETGTAKIIFIPTKYAAPTEPLLYTFSGSISFVDPFTGLQMTRELEAERLTINPSPELDLTYFMQRDILGDDPLTKDVVEPIVPSQFSLLINNKGYGDATKVKMLTNQPQIVENEKGLLVNFEIQSSQLNGGDKTLALGGSVVTDFGTIPAHSQTYAQWWLTSTLTGHFLDYDVRATHVTSYDNPDLSLLDQVTIHELIHQIVIPTSYVTTSSSSSAPLIGFMANDEEDTYDEPDQLYLSNAIVRPIHPVTQTHIEKLSDTEYTLTVLPSQQGWNYGNLADPTGGRRMLKAVTKQNGCMSLPLENFWQTDRTLIDMNEPVYENLIHFADSMTLAGETYTLTFETRPSTVLAVQQFSGIPARDSYTRIPVDTVTVTFNKPIRPETFTTEDLTVMHQGERLTLDGVIIKPVNEVTYKIGLTSLTTLDGYYSITVQTAEIEDTEGYTGENGKMSSWIQVHDGKARLTLQSEPADAGVLTPGTSDQDYFGTVGVAAVANEGYTFVHWKQGDDIVSTDAAFDFHQTGPQTLTAVFMPKTYSLTVNYEEAFGRVAGTDTGFIDYGTDLRLTATPQTGFYFDGWYEDDVLLSDSAVLNFTMHGNKMLEARFLQLQPLTVFFDENHDNSSETLKLTNLKTHELTLATNRVLSPTQWNTFCAPIDLSEQQINKVWGYSTMLLEFTSLTGTTLNFTYVYEMKAGRAYLVKPERRVLVPEFTFGGNAVVAQEPISSTFDGYEFCGIYSPRLWEDYTSEYYYGTQSNTLISAKTTTPALKGMRAYFIIPGGSSVKLNLGGIVTDIDSIADDSANLPQRIYTLQGIYAGTDWDELPAGIYIVNGQKKMKR
ncbi:MAG: hypothetical protein K5778_01530 [Bacteroidaceae bacterium]|nr:hypothetical protein [Bacteroidaceae bacterium]